jgi:hypothetical protein
VGLWIGGAWLSGTVFQTWQMGGSVWCGGVAVYGGHMNHGFWNQSLRAGKHPSGELLI